MVVDKWQHPCTDWFPTSLTFTLLFNLPTTDQLKQEEAEFPPVSTPRWLWNNLNNCGNSNESCWWRRQRSWRVGVIEGKTRLNGHSRDRERSGVVSETVPLLKCVSSQFPYFKTCLLNKPGCFTLSTFRVSSSNLDPNCCFSLRTVVS